MNENITECPHLSLIQKFCCRCGIYCEKKLGVYGLKSTLLDRQNLFSHDAVDILKANHFDLSKNKDYSSISKQIMNGFTQIINICDQIVTNSQTKILSLYIFWHSHQNYKNLEIKDILLSVFIALKYQDPLNYMRKYGKIREKIIHSIFQSSSIGQKELIYEQMQILQNLNFRLKLVTFVDFLEFYVISGVMFTNEGRKVSDYNQIISYIDSQVKRYIDKGLFFTEKNQEYLALKILYHARQKCGGIDEIWNWHIEYITKTKKDMIDKIIRERKALASLREMSLEKQNIDMSNISSKFLKFPVYQQKRFDSRSKIYS